jgi:hypothetical protein
MPPVVPNVTPSTSGQPVWDKHKFPVIGRQGNHRKQAPTDDQSDDHAVDNNVPNIVPVFVYDDDEESPVVDDIVDDSVFVGGITIDDAEDCAVVHRRGVVGCAGGADLDLNDRTI